MGKCQRKRKSTVSSITGNLFVWTVATFLLNTAPFAQAQQPKKIPRIGYLVPAAQSHRTEALRQGLRDLGYVEGKNIVIESRSAEGNSDRLPTLAAELVRLKIDLILVQNNVVARAGVGRNENDSDHHGQRCRSRW